MMFLTKIILTKDLVLLFKIFFDKQLFICAFTQFLLLKFNKQTRSESKKNDAWPPVVTGIKFPCQGSHPSWHPLLIWHRFWLLLLLIRVLCASPSGVSVSQPSARIDDKVTNESQELTLWHKTGDQDLCQELQTICGNKLQTIIFIMFWVID